ncbi:MAG: DMT family transporter [Candidatus Bipolaricaulis sp.]|nr:DMT family transporter [Candidatus Bipolaricaulis sp.]
MSTWAIPLAVGAAAAWALGMTAAKPALRSWDGLSYLLGRWVLVALLALLYAGVSGQLAFPGWRPAAMAALAGVLDASVGGILYVTALQRTSAYQATTLSNTAPFWGVLASVAFLGEPLRWGVFVAAGLVVVGAWFLTERDAANGRPSDLAGTLLALAAGVLWGFAETVPSKLALDSGLSPATLLFLFAVSGALGVLALMPLLRRRIPRRTERRGLSFVVLSAVGGAFLGWILWLVALAQAPASILSPVRGATMAFAFAYSVVFLRERPTRRAILGLAFAVAGVFLVVLVV